VTCECHNEPWICHVHPLHTVGQQCQIHVKICLSHFFRSASPQDLYLFLHSTLMFLKFRTEGYNGYSVSIDIPLQRLVNKTVHVVQMLNVFTI
jgi:hypothetical protein